VTTFAYRGRTTSSRGIPVMAHLGVSLLLLSTILMGPGEETPRLRLLLLGDSITKGVRPGVLAKETFGGLLQTEFARKKWEVSIVNTGVGGERTDQALKRVDQVIAKHRPDLVTIMYGTNDSYVDQGKSASRLNLDQYRANLSKLIDRLENQGAGVVLMTSPRWADGSRPNGLGEEPNLRLEPYVEVVRAVARERGLPLVDHYAAWTKAKREGVSLMEWTTDGCHPNPKGHRVLADLILPKVEPLLTSMKKGKSRGH